MIVIDLFGGDDDVISLPHEEDPEEVAKREEMRIIALEEIFRRQCELQLEIVPVEPDKGR
jgi:hypothetical protein